MIRIAVTMITLCIFYIDVSFAQNITYRGLGKYRDAYHTELLQLILDEVKPNNFTVKSYDKRVPHLRGFDLLSKGESLDIMIGYATHERVKKYRAIELPIIKGLNGWRASLVHKDNIEIFKDVSTLEQMRQFIPGSFHTWTDGKILLANKIQMLSGTDFVGLFRMLDTKRFDYFPLSILELAREAEYYKAQYNLDIAIEPNLLITYPVCFYFYVAKENEALAKVLTDGFEKIIANGKFDALFERHHRKILDQLLTGDRKVIRLINPLLPSSTPLERDELWLHYQYDEKRKTTLY